MDVPISPELLVPEGRFNRWRHREPLVADQARYMAAAGRAQMPAGAAPIVRDVLYQQAISGCQGIEFVAFSATMMTGPASLPGGVVLHPCFPPSMEGMHIGDPLFGAARRMADLSRYVYDGWLPAPNLDAITAAAAVRRINEALAAIPLVGGSRVTWEPKYRLHGDGPACPTLGATELADLSALASAIQRLPPDDRSAVMRTIGWLSASNDTSDGPAAFLFAVVAVESLCAHIERAARKNSSSLLRSAWPAVEDAAAESKKRQAAARAVLDELLDVDFEKAIRDANGVLNSTTNVTKTVLGSVLKDAPEAYASFFEGADATYNLRHLVAHGTLEPLDPVHLDRLAAKLYAAQTIGIRLVFRLLKATVGFALSTNSVNVVQSLGLLNMVLGNRGMYEGPTEMALLYR